MCNIKYYIAEIAAYFGNMLGEKVALESADKDLLERIPMNVSSRFSFYKGCILGQLILMAYLKDGDSVPPAQLKKQLDIIGRQTQLVVVLITPCIIIRLDWWHKKLTLLSPTGKCSCHLFCLTSSQTGRLAWI